MEDIIDDCTNGPSDDEDDFDWLKLSSAKVIGVAREYKEDCLSRTPNSSIGFKHTESKVINYDENISKKLKDDLRLPEEEDEFDMELESYTENDVEDAVVHQFIKWTISVDTGNCSERSAKQHAVL